MGKLDGKVAIITGGNSGIGAETGRLFAAEGARVILMARRVPEGEAIVAEIRESGGEATFVACDVGDNDSVVAAVDEAANAYGQIDLLFNNAGGGAPGTFPNEPNEEWLRVVNVNLTGTFYVSQAVWPHIAAQGGGAIVNMSSLAAQRGFSSRMQDEFGTASASYYAAKARGRRADALHGRRRGPGQHSRELRTAGSDHHAGRDSGDLQRSRRRTPRLREDV